ncbi:MAG: hypothetical protein ACTS2F_26985 [Thainema sp.]
MGLPLIKALSSNLTIRVQQIYLSHLLSCKGSGNRSPEPLVRSQFL